MLERELLLGKLMIPPVWVLITHERVKHAESELRGKNCLIYHIHLILKDVQPLAAVAFAYETIFCTKLIRQ